MIHLNEKSVPFIVVTNIKENTKPISIALYDENSSSLIMLTKPKCIKLIAELQKAMGEN
jgi:hypothetical protein